jgi:hypothetical protein
LLDLADWREPQPEESLLQELVKQGPDSPRPQVL